MDESAGSSEPLGKSSVFSQTFRLLRSHPIESVFILLIFGISPSWLSMYLSQLKGIQSNIVGLSISLLATLLTMTYPLFVIALVALQTTESENKGLGGVFLIFFRYLGRFITIIIFIVLRVFLFAIIPALVAVGLLVVFLLTHHAGQITQETTMITVVTLLIMTATYYLVLRRRAWAYYVAVFFDQKPKLAMSESTEVAKNDRRFTETIVLVGLILPIIVAAFSLALSGPLQLLTSIVLPVLISIVQLVVGVMLSLRLLQRYSPQIEESALQK